MTTNQPTVKALTALCFNMMPMEADAEGTWLPMVPAGVFQGIDGRSWKNDSPDAVVSRFMKKRPFDMEHSTHIKAPLGEPAPAYGWITKVENREGEIWALVKWNEEGKAVLEKQQYAFYSPSFSYDPSGQVLALVSAALTNDPNLNVPALNRKEDNPMKLPQLIVAALGIAAEATEEQAVVAINALKQEKDIALNRANQPDLNKFVPIETHTVALNRAGTAEAELKKIKDQEIDALVQAAIDEGKVAPANKEMFLGMCRTESGVAQFKAFVGTAPAIANNAVKKVPVDDKAKEGQLSADELAMCRAMNVTHESWIAARHHKPTY